MPNARPESGEQDHRVDPIARGILRVIPLGGLEEIGKNMMVFEYEDDLVVVDAGLMFPDESMPGIDLVVQDISYLVRHRDKVRGYVITHGHEDHTGGLAYALQKVPAPVFATRLTRGLIEVRLREHKFLEKTEIITVAAGTTIAMGAIQVEFFHQCHSIPDAVGLALHTPLGTVVHTGDFKFDQTPVDGRVPDYNTLARLGAAGVLALFSDSTRADTSGSTPSEAVISDAFQRIFFRARGRIIIATFASLISRIQLIVNAAVDNNRRVAIVGRGMTNNVSRAIELGYLQVPSGILARLDELAHISHPDLVIVTTGSQGEPTSALTRMSQGEQKHVAIVKGDTVIISSTPIPGNEDAVARNIDRLFKLGAQVIHERQEQVHVSGHGAADDLKLMIGLLRPRFLVPIHGHFRQLALHKVLGVQMGIQADHILLIDNGTVLETDGKQFDRVGRVDAGSIFVDGGSVGDVGDAVLRERRALAREGIVVATVIVDRQTGRPLAPPSIITRGFTNEGNADALIEKARVVVYDALDVPHPDLGEWHVARTIIQETLNRFLHTHTRRRPMIVSTIIEV